MSFKKITQFFKYHWLILSLIFVVGLIVFLIVSLINLPFYQVLLGHFNHLKSTENRVNILILGAGGENHTAGDLTDTIIVVSVNLKNYFIFTPGFVGGEYESQAEYRLPLW